MRAATSCSPCSVCGKRAGVSRLRGTRALDAHLRGIRDRTRARHAPGSYAWPELRIEAEDAFLGGEAPDAVIAWLRAKHREDFARVPTAFTMRRWHRERRWLALPSRASP